MRGENTRNTDTRVVGNAHKCVAESKTQDNHRVFLFETTVGRNSAHKVAIKKALYAHYVRTGNTKMPSSGFVAQTYQLWSHRKCQRGRRHKHE